MSFFTDSIKENTFQKIYDNTYNEFFRDIEKDLTAFIDSDNTNPLTKALSECSLSKVLIKTEYSSEVDRLSKKYHPIVAASRTEPSGRINRSEHVQMDKIESNTNLIDSLNIIKGIRETIKGDFYGAILIDYDSIGRKRTSINPLNPVMASILKEAIKIENKNILGAKYHIIIYSFKSTERIKDFKKTTPYENEEEDIKDLIVATHIQKKVIEEYRNIRKGIGTQVIYDVVAKDENGNQISSSESTNYSIVPIQISNNNGVMYPSYGSVLFQRSRAKNMSPFLSANIGTTSDPDAWSNACAGSLNTTTDEGKKTLNHSNSGSPLNRSNLKRGAYVYAQKCIDISLSYLLDEDISSESEKKRISLQEYRQEHPDAPISEYIEYIRELNISELPNWE